MRWKHHFFPFFVNLFIQGVYPQTIQSYWTVPDGELADFKQTFKNKQTLPVAWNGWDSDWTDQYLDGDTVVDLWVTSFNYDQYEYSQLLKDNVNISSAGTYTWVIDINSTVLAGTAEFVLRWKQISTTFNSSSSEISSPGFIILQASSTTSVSATHTASSTNTATSSSTTTPPATSQTGLSSGAKVGIGVGCGIGCVAVICLLAFLWRRKQIPSSGPSAHSLRQKNMQEMPYGPSQNQDPSLSDYNSMVQSRLHSVSELPSQRPVAELPAEHPGR